MGTQSIQQAKTELLRQAAHRARNSLNGVVGLAELLGCSGAPQDPSLYASMRTSAGDIKSVLQPLLDIAIADARMPSEPRSVPIGPLLQELVEFHQILARERQIRISCEISDEVPPTLWADRLKLALLIHLLVARVAAAADNDGHVTVAVTMEDGRPRLVIAQSASVEAAVAGSPQGRPGPADLAYLGELLAALDAAVTAEGLSATVRLQGEIPHR